MEIHDSCYMELRIPGYQETLTEVIKGRDCTLVEIPNNIEEPHYWVGDRFEVRVRNSDRNADFVWVLSVGKDYDERHPMWTKKLKLTADETMDFIRDKDLIYRTLHASCNANGEQVIREHFFSDILRLRDRRANILYDDFYDIKIFLRKEHSNESEEQKQMEPIDIRTLDINSLLLEYITEILKLGMPGYMGCDPTDYYLKFAAVSPKQQAQYYLTRFHSDSYCAMNPVCILCYRFSAFILPGGVSPESMNAIPNEKRAVSIADKKRYMIDSIFFNSDVCDNLKTFENMLYLHYVDIDFRSQKSGHESCEEPI